MINTPVSASATTGMLGSSSSIFRTLSCFMSGRTCEYVSAVKQSSWGETRTPDPGIMSAVL